MSGGELLEATLDDDAPKFGGLTNDPNVLFHNDSPFKFPSILRSDPPFICVALCLGSLTVFGLLATAENFDAGQRDGRLRGLSHFACMNGDLAVCKSLHASGVDFASPDADGRTPAEWAAEFGKSDVLAWLREIEAVPEWGNALSFAALHGHLEAMRFLIKDGAEERDAVHRACEGGQHEALQMLLEQGASATGVDARGRTPIEIAVLSGCLETATLLFRYGAAPVQRLVTLSVKSGSLDVLKFLVDEKRLRPSSRSLNLAVELGACDCEAFLRRRRAEAEQLSDEIAKASVVRALSAFDGDVTGVVEQIVPHVARTWMSGVLGADGGSAITRIAVATQDPVLIQAALPFAVSHSVEFGLGNALLHALASVNGTITAEQVNSSELLHLGFSLGDACVRARLDAVDAVLGPNWTGVRAVAGPRWTCEDLNFAVTRGATVDCATCGFLKDPARLLTLAGLPTFRVLVRNV
jgi:hypothetical protein